MHFLDLCDDVLLEILLLVDPIDLVNIYNVCERLKALAEGIINKVVLKLQLTGIGCFPNLKPHPFDNLDRIRVNRNWLDGKFSRKTLYPFTNGDWGEIIVDDNLYVADMGAIRKYDRLWNGDYLSSDFQLIGKVDHCKIIKFTKKDNVIFAACLDNTCVLFEDEKPLMRSPTVSDDFIDRIDFFPKNDLYVTACYESINIWNRRPNNESLLPVDNIPGDSYCLKIDHTGEKLIIGTADNCSLYFFNTMTKEDLHGLDEALDLLWIDNQTFLSGHKYGSLKLFDLRTKSVCQQINLWRLDYNYSIQFDGQNTVLCGFEEFEIDICDLRMNRVKKMFKIFNKKPLHNKPLHNELLQIVADPKHLFVLSERYLTICDFSV